MTGDEDIDTSLGIRSEEEKREILEKSEYDTELGLEVARDAQRVVAGEMSEEKFYSKHHDNMEDEFGRDERPVDPPNDDAPFLVSSEDTSGETRRETMKKMGLGAAALGLGSFATVEDWAVDLEGDFGSHTDGPDEDDTRWGMVIDLERCDGCLGCVGACNSKNQWEHGETWLYVLSYQNEDWNPEEADLPLQHQDLNQLVRPCQHCNDPPCTYVCPTTAAHQREDGIVLRDYDVCIGCRYCQVGCPYGVNYFGWGDREESLDELHESGALSRATPADWPDDDPPAELEGLDEGEPVTSDELRAMENEDRQELLVNSGDDPHDSRGRWVSGRPPKGVMGKCVFCVSNQDGHHDDPNAGEDGLPPSRDDTLERGTTSCEVACAENMGMHAIHFGDLNNPESKPNRYLEWRRRQAEGQLPSISNELEIHNERQEEITATIMISDPDTGEEIFEETRTIESVEAAESVVTYPDLWEELEVDDGNEQEITIDISDGPTETSLFEISPIEGREDAVLVRYGETLEIHTEPWLSAMAFADSGIYDDPPGRLETFKLLEEQGTDPSIIYIGSPPGPNDKQIDQEHLEGGGSYETYGDNRRDEELEGETVRVGDVLDFGGAL